MTPHLQRRCVACGRREHKSVLLRVGLQEGAVVLDRAGSLKGRGAYCHAARDCVLRLDRKGLLERAFRIEGASIGREQKAALLQELLEYIG